MKKQTQNFIKPAYKKKLYEQVVEQLQNLIENQELKGGDKLPPERKLAEFFQVSRNSVREAIRVLEKQKIVVSKPGAGTYIVQTKENPLISAMAGAIEKERSRLKEVFELRKILEPQIAALAAQRITDETIGALEEIVKQQKKAFKANQSSIELDDLFHLILIKATGNSIIFNMFETIHDIIKESRSETLQSVSRNQKSIEIHLEIINALKQRDPKQAENKMKKHLQLIEELLNISNITT